jgi:peroxiredoxin
VSSSLNQLPAGLPVPENDGACQHLIGLALPDLTLAASDGSAINLSHYSGWLVIYCYPMTGRPDTPLPQGWDEIAGARGCTPQSCAFRDYYQALSPYVDGVFGLSSQNSDYQAEAAQRLHLPYPLLSDSQHLWCDALQLPSFKVAGMRLIKRLTIIAHAGKIQYVFYPVFPPDQNAAEVLNWLQQHV